MNSSASFNFPPQGNIMKRVKKVSIALPFERPYLMTGVKVTCFGYEIRACISGENHTFSVDFN